MKRILYALFAVIFVLAMLACTAVAEEIIGDAVEAIEQVTREGLPTEPFTWAALGTIAGCTAFALLFVQLIKAPLDKIWKIPTRALVYVVCLVVMLLSAVFSGDGLTPASALLAVVNAVIPTLAAMGAYEMTFGRKK